MHISITHPPFFFPFFLNRSMNPPPFFFFFFPPPPELELELLLEPPFFLPKCESARLKMNWFIDIDFKGIPDYKNLVFSSLGPSLRFYMVSFESVTEFLFFLLFFFFTSLKTVLLVILFFSFFRTVKLFGRPKTSSTF